MAVTWIPLRAMTVLPLSASVKVTSAGTFAGGASAGAGGVGTVASPRVVVVGDGSEPGVADESDVAVEMAGG